MGKKSHDQGCGDVSRVVTLNGGEFSKGSVPQNGLKLG